jgi:hypothetical protein
MRWLGAALVALLAFAGIIAQQRHDAAQDERREAENDDYENAADIRNRVERNLDDRVREFDGSGFRD